ncbi:septum formation initiator precursor [Gemmobacter aquaticus]|jgi:cell division protein FtsB|uniref:Septum formation initiator n=1 Tax=Gemmobacter aquaticus TaxID=490185 RepID=A0A917YGX5_9RHOB|nr:septum formation initiator family protein [Gemmobacter aquaticus]GGO25567.1 septum formation initiator precursor [Gemmobacter aquaticus]
MKTQRFSIASLMIFALALVLGFYFAFAAVQGDFGVFRRVQIKAEAAQLVAERDRLKAELEELNNRTYRLSDAYLDLDLLDEQVREVLGYIRADEIVIR